MPNNEAISKAIDDLSSQKIPNVNVTAEKYNIIQFMLHRCFTMKFIIRHKSCSKSFMLFTNVQKLILIEHINEFSVRDLHLMFQLFKKFVVEMTCCFIKK